MSSFKPPLTEMRQAILPDRMPPIPTEKMTDAQIKQIDTALADKEKDIKTS